MEYENISLGEAIEILEEVMELDDSIYAYNRKYRMALEFVIDCVKRDMAESETDFPQAEDIEPTVESFSKVLDNKLISDAIHDCRADMKKSCNTCKNNDDEFSGECYECLKGIFDHYEPEEVKAESEDMNDKTFL